MSSLKKIEFSEVTNVKITTGEIKVMVGDAGIDENWFKAEFYAVQLEREAQRREIAIRIGGAAGCGLDISVYENYTEYFLNYNLPDGLVQERFYGGVNDERNV
jgi:hypothetical protein